MFASFAAAVEQAKISPAAELVGAKRVLIIGHRGASAHAPENTLPSFEAAVKAKADMVELDYYHSADKVPVVMHDKDLDRTTDAGKVLGKYNIKLEDVTVADLKKVDAGKWFKTQFAGTKVPTLEEAFTVIQAGSMTLIERKGGDAATIVKMLDDKKLRGNVVVQAFDWKYIADCHKLAPDLALGCLGSKELGTKQIADAKQAGAAAVGWRHSDLTKENIAAAHAAGLKCWAYTVNDKKRGQQLIDVGIDGIITDDPGLMRELLK